MRKMTLPPHQALDVLALCVADVDDHAAHAHYVANQAHIENAIPIYDAASLTATWFTLPSAAYGNNDAIVAGTITKRQLMDLYSVDMVKGTGPCRKTYDEMLVRANGKCPYCGGLGVVYSLDHYLPKARFPLYSVLPANLVPSCSDCNKGKSSSFATTVGQQTIHPYYDHTRFFSERWIVAYISRSNPPTASFHCAPPPGWSDSDKQRVHTHFKDHKLAYRFGVVSGSELTKIMDFRKRSLKGLSSEAFKDFLLDGANTSDYDLNGWNRSLHAALAATDWFLTADFSRPETWMEEQAVA